MNNCKEEDILTKEMYEKILKYNFYKVGNFRDGDSDLYLHSYMESEIDWGPEFLWFTYQYKIVPVYFGNIRDIKIDEAREIAKKMKEEKNSK